MRLATEVVSGHLPPKKRPIANIEGAQSVASVNNQSTNIVVSKNTSQSVSPAAQVKPNSSPAKKQESLSIKVVPPLRNMDEIVDWIINNKAFIVASFTGQLDVWVDNKLKSDKAFKAHKPALDRFIFNFHKIMHEDSTIDVRKYNPITKVEDASMYPDPYACFIDAINGLTGHIFNRQTGESVSNGIPRSIIVDKLAKNIYGKVGERNSESILSNVNNNLLIRFLMLNPRVAACLSLGLPTLNPFATVWSKEYSASLSPPKSQVPPLSPAKTTIKSPNKENLTSNKKPAEVYLAQLASKSMSSLLGLGMIKNNDSLQTQPSPASIATLTSNKQASVAAPPSLAPVNRAEVEDRVPSILRRHRTGQPC